ncbi:hypothetical protein EPN95_03085 [Patescibacteria group bacterium]|nr:MAG: hypothetical protein EPN95_03085 [Patescibacteria group bacterium]
MQFAYISAAIIFLAVWIILFLYRKDLHREMLTMSLFAVPLGLFDFWAVPLYWQPVTLFNIPIGIEGLIYSFCLGGITSVIYAEVAHKRLQHIHKWHKSAALIVFLATAIMFLPLAIGKVANPVIILYVSLLTGLGVALYLRKDLVRSTIIGGLCFGILYFLLLRFWLSLYPSAANWFVFQGLPQTRILGVPLWELLFGTVFAAYWGNVYELLFGYRLIRRAHKSKKKVSYNTKHAA